MSRVLDHQTIYESSDNFELNLPVIDSLRVYHKNGSFPLIKNPDLTKSATMCDYYSCFHHILFSQKFFELATPFNI